MSGGPPPPVLSLGRGVFLILVAGLVLLVLFTLPRLPPVVASHFDGAGAPNGWSSRTGYAALLVGIGAVLPLGIVALVHGVTRRGAGLLNIPARDYWLRPEHAPAAVRRVRAYMWWLGCVMTGIAIAIHWLILAANARRPARLDTAAIVTVLAGALLALLLWAAGFYRLMRPPTASPSPPPEVP